MHGMQQIPNGDNGLRTSHESRRLWCRKSNRLVFLHYLI